MTSGTIAVVLGLASWLLSRGRDGFDKGLFTGMTVAFMLIGAYLLGSAARTSKQQDRAPERGGDDTNDDGMWLPSRDEQP